MEENSKLSLEDAGDKPVCDPHNISPMSANNSKIEFKKPESTSYIGKIPKKLNYHGSSTIKPNNAVNSEDITKHDAESKKVPPAAGQDIGIIPYREPKWSGLCPDGSEYSLEVLKSGMIVEKVELGKKSHYVFGRLANCDVILAHPTVSRYHAVLQYKAFAEEGEQSAGWYLYDMGSTHGTYLNKERVKSNHYARVRVGHQIKFGNSTRTYIMLGPDFDSEGESDLSVTEIKKRANDMKLERDRLIKEAIEQRQKDKIEEERRKEEQGIDWGMGEDAEEEPDLTDNPYASTANEELYLEDPKKTLRGYFEREGHELSYDCEERGVGQFICRVELPIDDAHGKPMIAEVIHKGKKKEAVISCALEACRILDRAGLLRQSKHESRRRKQRDWSADDYYDSDDDNFLDRTGSVEKKRKLRMMKHGAGDATEAAKPLTYSALQSQISDYESEISAQEKCLEHLRSFKKVVDHTDGEADALEEYMSALNTQGQSIAQKVEISKTKMSIQKLKSELNKVLRLAELARPANMPPLVKRDDSKLGVKVGTNSVVYGKRIRLKDDVEKRHKPKLPTKKEDEGEFIEEMDSDEETPKIHEEPKKEQGKDNDEDSKDLEDKIDMKDVNKEENVTKKIYGPMRPPENYVIPDNYFDQETERDLPEIMEDD